VLLDSAKKKLQNQKTKLHKQLEEDRLMFQREVLAMKQAEEEYRQKTDLEKQKIAVVLEHERSASEQERQRVKALEQEKENWEFEKLKRKQKELETTNAYQEKLSTVESQLRQLREASLIDTGLKSTINSNGFAAGNHLSMSTKFDFQDEDFLKQITSISSNLNAKLARQIELSERDISLTEDSQLKIQKVLQMLSELKT